MKACLALLIAFSFLPLRTASQGLGYERNEQGVRIFEGEREVLFYRTAPASFEGTYQRAHYIHPLYNTDGNLLTEDFPEDHRHHRGIFWAWHQVLVGEKKMGDAWECRDFIWDVKETSLTQKDSSLLLHSRVHWKSPLLTDPDGAPISFVEEECRIRVFPQQGNYRRIGVEIALRALVEGVRIGGSEDEKGYGGFSVRAMMPKDLQFEGAGGRITPVENALYSGNWTHLKGSFSKDGQPGGILIISHNPGEEKGHPWILRQSGSMQNQVYPGREPVAVSTTHPTLLRYTLVVHSGELGPGIVNDLLR
jgi:hypothetical protein